jgi:hypothetical protein
MDNLFDEVTKREVVAYDEFDHWMYFDSISAACEELGVDHASISRCCQGVQQTAMGYKFEYYEDFDQKSHEIGDFIIHQTRTYTRKPYKKEKELGNYVAIDIKTLKYRLYDSFVYMCHELSLDERNARRVLKASYGHKTVGGYRLYRENAVDFTKLNGPF